MNQDAQPRFPLLGICVILFGLAIMALSYPVSHASHAIADELKDRKPVEKGVRGAVKGGVKAVEESWKFSTKRQDNDLMKGLQSIVAVISLACCCCVGCMGMIAENMIEPVGRMLGVAAQFSVYTFAVFLAGYGVMHISLGIGLMRGGHWARKYSQPILMLDGFQGVFYLGAAAALWSADDPTYSVIALCLGALLVALCFPACWLLYRVRIE